MTQFFLAALTGILGFLSFPTYALDFCVWFCLVPLLVAVSTTALRRAFCLGCLAALAGFCGAFPWVVLTIARFEDVSLVTAFACALPAAAYHALQLGLFAAFAAWIMGNASKPKVERFLPRPRIFSARERVGVREIDHGKQAASPARLHPHAFDRLRVGSALFFGTTCRTVSLTLALSHAEETRGRGDLISALLSIASAWVVLEWSFPKVFPWSFATVLSDRLALIQIVEVTGVWGLSFVIAAVNAALAIGIVSWREHHHVAWRPLALAALLVLAVWRFGTGALKHLGEKRALHPLTLTLSRGERGKAQGLSAPEREEIQSLAHDGRAVDDLAGFALTIAVVQGNIGPGPRDPVAEGRTFSIYRQLTLRPPRVFAIAAVGAQDSDLIIWPETTIRTVLPETQQFRDALFDVAAQLQRPLLVGSLDSGDHGRTEFNSLFVVTPDRTLAGVYHKTRLLPFGESAPLLGSWWRTTGRFTSGEPARPLAVALSSSVVRGGAPQTLLEGSASGNEHESRARLTILFAPSICYEALFPGFFNGMVRDGAEFLVNITDDSWFGNGNAPWQHLQGAILRAVETRRPLVRASNSGISAVIEPSGRITARIELSRRALMQAVVTPARGRTPYVRWGNWFAWLCVGMTLFGVLIRWRWLSPLTSASRS
jgi:apolipoprotein N-acyltransferase